MGEALRTAATRTRWGPHRWTATAVRYAYRLRRTRRPHEPSLRLAGSSTGSGRSCAPVRGPIATCRPGSITLPGLLTADRMARQWRPGPRSVRPGMGSAPTRSAIRRAASMAPLQTAGRGRVDGTESVARVWRETPMAVSEAAAERLHTLYADETRRSLRPPVHSKVTARQTRALLRHARESGPGLCEEPDAATWVLVGLAPGARGLAHCLRPAVPDAGRHGPGGVGVAGGTCSRRPPPGRNRRSSAHTSILEPVTAVPPLLDGAFQDGSIRVWPLAVAVRPVGVGVRAAARRRSWRWRRSPRSL